MLEATLRVHVPGCWIGGLASRGMGARLVDRKASGPDGMKNLFEIVRRGDGGDWEELVADIRAHAMVTRVRPVYGDDERLLAIVHCRSCQSCRTLASSDCFVTGATSRLESMEWTLRFDDRRKLAKLVENLTHKKASVEVTRVLPVTGRSILTRRQAEVLAAAMEMGYFEFPKKVGIRELAERVGVSNSTVAETLHRAELKVLRSYADSHT